MSDAFQTEHEFELPLGYVDETGSCHRQGTMRLATAADEILPLRDPRVESNPAYHAVIVLARVVTRLGALPMVNTHVVEGLFARDFAYLQELYNRLNQNGTARVEAVCPKCEHRFAVEGPDMGGE